MGRAKNSELEQFTICNSGMKEIGFGIRTEIGFGQQVKKERVRTEIGFEWQVKKERVSSKTKKEFQGGGYNQQCQCH